MQLIQFCLFAKEAYQIHPYVGRCNTCSVLHLEQGILRYIQSAPHTPPPSSPPPSP